MMMSKLPALLLTAASPALLTGSPVPDKMHGAPLSAPSTSQLEGCEPAPSGKAAHVYYADAETGSDGMGNGSSALPWQSLQKALPKLRDGDVLRLRTGNYGPLALYKRFNTATVTIEADAGAHPHVDQITINEASHWRIRGLSVSLPDISSQPPLPNTYLVRIMGDHHEIRFENNMLGAFPQAGWTQQDYLSRVPSGIREVSNGNSSCIYIDRNKLRNIGGGIVTVGSQKVSIQGNQIDRFLQDGIDFGSSQIIIRDNVLTNRINGGDSEKLHPDFMQGQPARVPGTRDPVPASDILIERNTAILQTDPDLPFSDKIDPTFVVQGISAFDGDWTRVTIRNNLIITLAYHGITLMGVHDSKIVNNTVLGVDRNQKLIPWISITPAKSMYGTVPSSNVLVANNITTGILIDPRNDKITVAHNLVLQGEGPKRRLYSTSDSMLNPRDADRPGQHGQGNVISPAPYAAIFRRFDTANLAYDARVRSGLKLPVKPDTDLLPADDITGAKRQGTPMIGAFGEAP